MNTVRSFSLVFFSGGKKKTNMFGEELTHIHPLGLPHLTLQLSALVHRAQMWCPGLWSAGIPAEGVWTPAEPVREISWKRGSHCWGTAVAHPPLRGTWHYGNC